MLPELVTAPVSRGVCLGEKGYESMLYSNLVGHLWTNIAQVDVCAYRTVGKRDRGYGMAVLKRLRSIPREPTDIVGLRTIIPIMGIVSFWSNPAIGN